MRDSPLIPNLWSEGPFNCGVLFVDDDGAADIPDSEDHCIHNVTSGQKARNASDAGLASQIDMTAGGQTDVRAQTTKYIWI